MSKFFVVGDVTADLMYFVKALPEAGGEVTVTRAVTEPGGAGGTIATALARLGHEVTIATCIGKGPFSELALKNVLEAGVDISQVQRDPDLQTGSVILLITPDAQRTMISSTGASRNLDAAYLKADAITSCDALVMSAYSLVGGLQREYAVKALSIARQAGLTTFIDMGSGAVNALQDRLISLVQNVDYILMNQKELYTLTGQDSISDAIEELALEGIQRVIVKVGEMGSIVVTPELNELVEALEIDGVLDSTGAGDYYTAAFAHGILTGHDLQHAALLGNVAGALNTTAVGAQKVVVTDEMLEQYAEEMMALDH
ncbi:MAG: carbohydrate kinase family protein [Trueperaceae bacterium]|nr:carbohydrate kinase family protein [Trueperaceae bacterium]